MTISIPNFGYVFENKIAGSANPGFSGDLARALAELNEEGFGAILSLTETPLDRPLLGEFGFDYAHVPVIDFSSPSLEQIIEAVEFMDRHVGRDKAVLVHCTAGQGRTGTILATYLVARGFDPGEAIRTVRDLRPGSIETQDQEKAVFEYDRHLKEAAK
jgi:atypical dual specificity phosphatase